MRYITVLLAHCLIIGLISCTKTEDKVPPVAIFNIVPATGPFTQVFTFNAHDSQNPNAPDEDLQNRWDFNGDGIFDTEFSFNKGIEHQYTEPGHYAVILEVINSEGWTDFDIKNVVVYADSVPPTASFFATPDSSSVNTIFFFNAAGSSDQYTPLEEIQFRWDWQNDGIWDTPFTNDTCIYHKYDVSGVYDVLLEIRNNFSLTDTASRKLYVYDL